MAKCKEIFKKFVIFLYYFVTLCYNVDTIKYRTNCVVSS